MKKYIVIALAFVSVIASSCKSETASYFALNSSSIMLSKSGGSASVTAETDASAINVITAPDWLKVSVSDRTVTCTAKSDTTSCLRDGYVLVGCAGHNASIHVVQAGEPTFFFIQESKVSIDSDGSAAILHCYTDGCNVTAECPEGISCSYRYGQLVFTSGGAVGRGKTYKNVVVRCGNFSEKITLVQKGTLCERCNGRGYVTCSHCGGRGETYYPYDRCYVCNGKGTVRCPECKGRGL